MRQRFALHLKHTEIAGGGPRKQVILSVLRKVHAPVIPDSRPSVNHFMPKHSLAWLQVPDKQLSIASSRELIKLGIPSFNILRKPSPFHALDRIRLDGKRRHNASARSIPDKQLFILRIPARKKQSVIIRKLHQTYHKIVLTQPISHPFALVIPSSFIHNQN